MCGIAACVPPYVEENAGLPILGDHADEFIKTTGVERKRICDANICSSDLCFEAAQRLLHALGWEKESVDCLIFVSQTPDYILPATSCILQDRLGLSSTCYSLDISLGCSGWVYGLSVITSLLSAGGMKRGLLLAGDTISKICSKNDQSTRPLFGDAGTVTALEYTGNQEDLFYFQMNSDGHGYDAIIVPQGGSRSPLTMDSFSENTRDKGCASNGAQLSLEGMDVFSFGIKCAPESVKELLEYFKLDKEQIDYFLFHQANLFMNKKITKKIKISPPLDEKKVPFSLKDYGNTSCASIPLTMVTQLHKELKEQSLNLLACGFGVGLSWGSVYFATNHLICIDLIEI